MTDAPPDETSSRASSTPSLHEGAEAAWALRARALEEAQALIRGHLQRTAELRQTAIAAARELLGPDPSRQGLLEHLEASLTPTSPPDLTALIQDLTPGDSSPLGAIEQLMRQRKQSLDDAMQRFMQQRGAPPPSAAPSPPPRES